MRTPTTDRGRVLLVLAVVAVVTAFTATVPLLRDWFDLRVYYGTVHTWLHHGGRIYDYQVPGTTYGFTYPPFAAVSMAPMAYVGLGTAIVGALVLNLAALGVVLRILAGPGWRRYGWFGWALVACGLALFEPLRDTFSFGQVNLLLLALVLGDGWLLSTGRGRWAGVGIGLAAAIKLTLGAVHRPVAAGQTLESRRGGDGCGARGDRACGPGGPGRVEVLLDRRVVGHDPGGPPRLRLQPVPARSPGPARRDGPPTVGDGRRACPGRLGGASAPCDRRRGLDGRVRADRADRVSDQPDHLGAPPRVAARRPSPYSSAQGTRGSRAPSTR